MIGTLKNLLTGELVRVHSTTRHSLSSYGQAVWIDKNNECYGIVGMPIPGFELIKKGK